MVITLAASHGELAGVWARQSNWVALKSDRAPHDPSADSARKLVISPGLFGFGAIGPLTS